MLKMMNKGLFIVKPVPSYEHGLELEVETTKLNHTNRLVLQSDLVSNNDT